MQVHFMSYTQKLLFMQPIWTGNFTLFNIITIGLQASVDMAVTDLQNLPHLMVGVKS